MDIIGEIFPHSSKWHGYILIATDYFTWWTEEIPLKEVNEEEVINFLKYNNITKFGVPTSLSFNNATYLSLLKLYDFSLENGVVLKHSSNHYLQGNGIPKSANKNMICIIKKTMYSEQRS